MSLEKQDSTFYNSKSDEELILEPWMIADIKKAIEEVERGEYITMEELEAEIDSWD